MQTISSVLYIPPQKATLAERVCYLERKWAQMQRCC